MKQKVLILGKGYIGTKLAAYLKHIGDIECTCINQKEFNYIDTIGLAGCYDKYNPEIIVNACGYTGKPNVDACENNRATCWEYNVTFPTRLAHFCDKTNTHLIHMGSGCIYEELYAPEDRDINEDTPPNFGLYDERSSWYSKSKHASELAIQSTLSNYHILRLRMPFDHVVSERNFLCKVLKYDKLIVHQNSMTCINDLCIFTERLVKNYKNIDPGIYNVCNTGHASIKDIVEIFTKYNIINKNWEFVSLDSLKLQAGRSNVVLSTNKIKKLGLELPDLKQSLDRNIDRLCQELKNIN